MYYLSSGINASCQNGGYAAFASSLSENSGVTKDTETALKDDLKTAGKLSTNKTAAKKSYDKWLANLKDTAAKDWDLAKATFDAANTPENVANTSWVTNQANIVLYGRQVEYYTAALSEAAIFFGKMFFWAEYGT